MNFGLTTKNKKKNICLEMGIQTVSFLFGRLFKINITEASHPCMPVCKYCISPVCQFESRDATTMQVIELSLLALDGQSRREKQENTQTETHTQCGSRFSIRTKYATIL